MLRNFLIIKFPFLIYKKNACDLDSWMSILCKFHSDVVSVFFIVQIFVRYIYIFKCRRFDLCEYDFTVYV